jgi:hypothetical protein
VKELKNKKKVVLDEASKAGANIENQIDNLMKRQ